MSKIQLNETNTQYELHKMDKIIIPGKKESVEFKSTLCERTKLRGNDDSL